MSLGSLRHPLTLRLSNNAASLVSPMFKERPVRVTGSGPLLQSHPSSSLDKLWGSALAGQRGRAGNRRGNSGRVLPLLLSVSSYDRGQPYVTEWSDDESGNAFGGSEANGGANPFEDEAKGVRVRALYDYDGQEQDELSFKAGTRGGAGGEGARGLAASAMWAGPGVRPQPGA